MNKQTDPKTYKEILDSIDKIKKLEEQIKNPNREKMIDALLDAKLCAPFEIGMIELSQGNYVIMPPEKFSDAELYEKLAKYKKGLISHCIKGIGETLFNSLYNK